MAADELTEAVNSYLADQRRDLMRGQQQLETLRRSEQDLGAQIRQQSEDFLALQQLEREVDAARLLYETFFTRLQEASVQQGLETADARVLSEAVPRGASSPQRQRILLLSGILGAILGAGIVLVREWRFAGFRTSDDLRRETGQRILGSVPRLENDDRRFALQHMKTKPNSIFAEAVRNLRTSILMSNIDKEPQVILMTSSIPAEGKTTLSIALTRYLTSMEGKRALLLEADIRRKTLRAYVDNEPTISLMDVLLGKVASENIDLYNEELGIEVLAGSEAGGNAADLFASRRFKDLITALRQEFDYIVIDSPPVLAVPDARVLAGYADAVVFVVKWGSTTKTQVEQGVEMLRSVDARITGMILSGVDQNKMKSYGYKGQYGYDGYSSGYYGDK
jgi:capsular exopolysaccharide synthesis family protein